MSLFPFCLLSLLCCFSVALPLVSGTHTSETTNSVDRGQSVTSWLFLISGLWHNGRQVSMCVHVLKGNVRSGYDWSLWSETVSFPSLNFAFWFLFPASSFIALFQMWLITLFVSFLNNVFSLPSTMPLPLFFYWTVSTFAPISLFLLMFFLPTHILSLHATRLFPSVPSLAPSFPFQISYPSAARPVV